MPKLEPNPILNITGNKNTASVIQTLRPSHPGQPAIVVMKSKFPNKSSTMTLQQINLEQKVHIVFSETPCFNLLLIIFLSDRNNYYIFIFQNIINN